MQLPKGILFDLDDTLISFDGVSEGVWVDCCARTVVRFGLPVGADALWAQVRADKDWYWSDPERHRLGRSDLLGAQRQIVARAFGHLGLEAPEAEAFLAETYTRGRLEAVCLFPRSLETLERLRALGVRMALLTNGVRREQRGKIARFGLEPYFEVILVEEELGFGKPDPRVFNLALEALGLGPGEVWMVGDNLVWDVGAPQRLGIYSIWNDWRGRGVPPGSPVVSDRMIREVGELLPRPPAPLV